MYMIVLSNLKKVGKICVKYPTPYVGYRGEAYALQINNNGA